MYVNNLLNCYGTTKNSLDFKSPKTYRFARQLFWRHLLAMHISEGEGESFSDIFTVSSNFDSLYAHK